MFIHASNLGSTVKLRDVNGNENLVMSGGRTERKQNRLMELGSREFEQLTVLALEFPKLLHDTFDPDNSIGDYFISSGCLKISISSNFGTINMEIKTYY